MVILTTRTVVPAISIALLVSGLASAAGPPEAEVKAGLLYNFSNFVRWPPEAAPAPDLVIGIIGGDPLGQLAGEMSGRQVGDRRIRLVLLNDGDDPRDCHMLFVAEINEKRIQRILRRVGDVPVLTIGESQQFIEAGGVIRLYREAGRMRFEINLARAERVGLRISAKVLSLARIVRVPIASAGRAEELASARQRFTPPSLHAAFLMPRIPRG